MKRSLTLGILMLVIVGVLASAPSALAAGGDGYLEINGIATTTTSQTVSLSVNWPGNVDWNERPARVCNENGVWQSVVWTRHTTKNYDIWNTATWQLSAGPGLKSVKVELTGVGRKNLGVTYTISKTITLL